MERKRSEEDMDDILEKKYQYDVHYDCSNIRRITNEILSMEHCFINLGVVEQRKVANVPGIHSEVRKRPDNRIRLPSYEDLLSDTCQSIELENIFDSTSSDMVSLKRLLIYGKAGIGKTTFCKKIVYNFCKEGMWKSKFKRIVWIPLRQLKNLDKRADNQVITLQHIYSVLIFDNNQDYSNKLAEYEKDEETLYILDGWDEITELLDRSHHMSSVINKLINVPSLIVTSRPYSKGLLVTSFDKLYETVGFFEKDIRNYVTNVFPYDHEKRDEIFSFIEQYNVVLGLVTIPIQLDLFCNLWEYIKIFFTDEQDVTMTALYKLLLFKLWTMYIKNYKDQTIEDFNLLLKDGTILKYAEVQLASRVITKMAYDGILQNRIVFEYKHFYDASKDELSTIKDDSLECHPKMSPNPEPESLVEQIEALKNSHFINCLNPTDTDLKRKYEFIHLTFQELMAAVYIAKHLSSTEMLQLITKYKYNPRFQVIWSFVAGLIEEQWPISSGGDSVQSVKTFFDYLERSPIELVGFAHPTLILHCMGECHQILSEKDPKREVRLTNYLQHIIRKQRHWHLLSEQLPSKIVESIFADMVPPSHNESNEVYNSWSTSDDMGNQKIITQPEHTEIVKNLYGFEHQNWIPESILLQLLTVMSSSNCEECVSQIRHILRCYTPRKHFLSNNIVKKLTELLCLALRENKQKPPEESIETYINFLQEKALPEETLIVLYGHFVRNEFARLSIIKTLRDCEESLHPDFIGVLIGSLKAENPKVRQQFLIYVGQFKILLNEMQIEISEMLFDKEVNPGFVLSALMTLKHLDPKSLENIEMFFSDASVPLSKIFTAIQHVALGKQLSDDILRIFLDLLVYLENSLLDCESSSENKTQEISVLKMIFTAFKHQSYLPDFVTKVLLDFVQSDQQNRWMLYICNVFREVRISTTFEKELTKLSIRFINEENEHYITFLRIFSKRKMSPTLISTLHNKIINIFDVDDISTRAIVVDILFYLRNQQIVIPSEHVKKFSIFLLQLLKMENKMKESSVVTILSKNSHLFTDEVLKEIKSILTGELNKMFHNSEEKPDSDLYANNIYFLLKECVNLSGAIRLDIVKIFLQYPLKKTELSDDYDLHRVSPLKDPLSALRGLISSHCQINAIIPVILSNSSWDPSVDFTECVYESLRNVQFIDTFQHLDKTNWSSRLFTDAILKIAQDEFKFNGGIFGTSGNVSLCLNDENVITVQSASPESDKKYFILSKDKSTKEKCGVEKRLSELYEEETDFFSLYLKFHTPLENLKYIQEFPVKEDSRITVKHLEKLKITQHKYLAYIKLYLNEGANIDNIGVLCQQLQFEGGENYENIRHIDLSENHLNDRLLHCLIEFLTKERMKNNGLKVVTLILSHNQLTEYSVDNILGLAKYLEVKFLYLNGNFISFDTETNSWKDFVYSLTKVPFVEESCSADINEVNRPQLKLLDLSGNFIQTGSFKTESGNAHWKYTDKENIIQACYSKIHSFTPFWPQYLNDYEYDYKINHQMGCIILAEKRPPWYSPLGHRFIVVDWIPKYIDNTYGQRELIMSDLVASKKGGRFRIRINNISPGRLMKEIEKSTRNYRCFSRSTIEIEKVLKAIRKDIASQDIYNLKPLSTREDIQAGSFNCYTWVDKILKRELDIGVDSMANIKSLIIQNIFKTVYAMVKRVFWSVILNLFPTDNAENSFLQKSIGSALIFAFVSVITLYLLTFNCYTS